MLKFEKGVPVR
jgi:glucosamine-6-phosphate deaminase